jgi:2-C-methyl-D-erythritol 4-phosphate cytidylyltransferase
MPCVETLKQSSERNTIEKTVSRQDLWLAQTPQIFKVDTIQKAHQKALTKNFEATDDAQLVERMSLPVTLILGSPTNIKITTPEDLAFAEKLIKAGTVNL